jgi:AcrR family transcriptional regulator
MTTTTSQPHDPHPTVHAETPDSEDGGVPRSKRKRLRKEEIVAEATKLFAERGYEGASMGDLAERVGLRKASLFHHFPSKDVLYATVLGNLLESVRIAIQDALSAEGPYAVRLDALNDALTAALGAQPHAARLLVREAMDWGPVMRDTLGHQVNGVLAASLEFAKAGQREGAFAADVDPVQLVVTLVGVHFMPFAISSVVERFAGTSPFASVFVDERRRAVREQVRRLVLEPRR